MNPYLKRLRAQYDALKTSIEGLQTRAAAENRDLSEVELRSVSEQGEQAKALYTQIEMLTENEHRNAQVAGLAARVAQATSGQPDGDGDDAQGEVTPVGGATTTARDPGHYRSIKQGGTHSFFTDLWKAKTQDDDQAARRIVEHHRALATGSAGAGVVPPKWLVDEYAELARQGRALADAVRNIPLGDDPRPITLPKQTTGTDDEVTEQATEGDAIEDDDAWASDVDTVTPKPTAGSQVVTRQMLDMANPAIDSLIYGDLIAAYNLKVEKKVGTAVMAVGSALAALEDVDLTDEDHYSRVMTRAAVTVRQNRKLRASLFVMSVGRHGHLLDLRDTTGRPLVVPVGPSNALGTGDATDDGRYWGLRLIPTEAVVDDYELAAVRGNDVILFESNMLRFRYEEPQGPEKIKLGIWAYTAVAIRYGTAPIKKVEISAIS